MSKYNMFLHAKLTHLLLSKLKSGQLKDYAIKGNNLKITFLDKQTFNIDIKENSEDILTMIFIKDFPTKDSKETKSFLIREIRNIKILKLLK